MMESAKLETVKSQTDTESSKKNVLGLEVQRLPFIRGAAYIFCIAEARCTCKYLLWLL